jgi:hypothetical protein
MFGVKLSSALHGCFAPDRDSLPRLGMPELSRDLLAGLGQSIDV